ncbi:DUF3592 domain-containing protein [Kitasatospora sp. NPDC048722]|uniref:DUF3592 domain-containing protein n=1 Tax=Kitasatospora sp. NPDC048722 TaxID=3155639 RepID=UPI003410761B
MLFLGVALFVLVMTVRMVKYVLDLNADFRRVRREGVRLQAEVVDYDKRTGDRADEFHLRPIVRYHLGDRAYQGTVSNASGSNPPPLGSFTTVVVSPKTPYVPYDPYLGIGGAVVFAFAALAAAVGMLSWAVARL